MAVRIRLKRTGARNAASFRVVAADARSPRDGRFLETLGWYDPRQPGDNFKLKLDRIEYWLGQGAQVSDTVRSLMRKSARSETETAPAAAPTESAAEQAPDGSAPDAAAVAAETGGPADEPSTE